MTQSASRYGPFQVLGKLGSGGMGEVYRARDPRLNRDVAIKVLAQAGTDPARHRRLTDEAQAASALNHANIVTVFDVGVHEDVPFIVSELVEGVSLRSMLARAPLPIRDVLDLAAQMAEGLAAAHQAGIVHRDFKPENVMVTPEGLIKILDFGLAKMPEVGGARLTSTAAIFGTPQFMAPEQAAGVREQDARVDIYALGAVLYAMLSNALPYEAENYNLLINAILNRDPTPITERIPGLDPKLASIVMRALAKKPEDRFQSARELFARIAI